MFFLIKALHSHLEGSVSTFKLATSPRTGSCRGAKCYHVSILGLWMGPPSKHQMFEAHLQNQKLTKPSIQDEIMRLSGSEGRQWGGSSLHSVSTHVKDDFVGLNLLAILVHKGDIDKVFWSAPIVQG